MRITDYDFMYLFVDFGPAFVRDVARRYGHHDLDQLMSKLLYVGLVDQIGTILDGGGLALEGQEDLARLRLKQLLPTVSDASRKQPVAVFLQPVEIIVEESSWVPSENLDIVGIHGEIRNPELQCLVKQNGGKWNSTKRVSGFQYDLEEAITLMKRRVKLAVSDIRHHPVFNTRHPKVSNTGRYCLALNTSGYKYLKVTE